MPPPTQSVLSGTDARPQEDKSVHLGTDLADTSELIHFLIANSKQEVPGVNGEAVDVQIRQRFSAACSPDVTVCCWRQVGDHGNIKQALGFCCFLSSSSVASSLLSV